MAESICHPSICIDSNLYNSQDGIIVTEESASAKNKISKRLKFPTGQSTEEPCDLFTDQAETSLDDEQAKKNLLESIKLWREVLSNIYNAKESKKNEFEQKRQEYTIIFNNFYNRKICENDHAFSREVFFGYLDILNVPDVYRFLTAKSWSTQADAIMESHVYIIGNILSIIVSFVPFYVDDLYEYYDPLLNAIRVNIEQALHAVKSVSSGSKSVYRILLDFIWNLADGTLTVPSLIRNGFAKSVLELFVLPTLSSEDKRPLNSIIHNLSRHDQGADELNKYNAIEILKASQEKETDKSWDVSFINVMTLAHLYTPNQIKDDPSGIHSIMDQLLDVTIKAESEERYRYQGFHISEPLSVLAKIFVNDSAIDYVLNQAKIDPPINATLTISLFSDLLLKFVPSLSKNNQLEQFACIALCNIIWSISFHDRYHSILKQNVELIDTIRILAQVKYLDIVEQYIPRTMLNIKKAADGILFNLNLEETVSQSFELNAISRGLKYNIDQILNRGETLASLVAEQPPMPTIPAQVASLAAGPMGPPPMPGGSAIPPMAPAQSVPEKPLVMISYCHANNDFCDKILELLDQKADVLDVWIDRRCCKSSGDVWESIARGIKGAQLIICIVSTEYLASKACRQEIIYAKDRLNKPFLPVYVEKPVVSDWLDIRLAEFKYVRFQNTNLKLDERKVQEFLATLMETILPGHEKTTETPIVHHSQPTPKFLQTSHQEPDSQPIQTTVLTQSRSAFQVDKPSVSEWTSAEIHQWFDEKQIPSEIRDLYNFKTGAQMIAYAECFSEGWQKQYERYAPRYAERYQGKELSEHEFALFASALKELYIKNNKIQETNNHSNSNSKESALSTAAPQQSCWCVIL